MQIPNGFKPVQISLNHKPTEIQGMYHIIEQKTVVGVTELVKLLIPGSITQGLGDTVNIVTPTTPPPKFLQGRRIAISAAHGNGRNVSSCNSAYNEANFVLEVVLKLAPMLILDGAVVFLPRTKLTEDMSLQTRSERIDQFGADLCIEVHTDSIGTGCTIPRGTHIIRQISRPGDPLAHALFEEIYAATGLPQRFIWAKEGSPGFDWYYMLRVPRAHNLLIELGFHSNKQDLEFLLSPGAPRLCAQGIRNGIVKHYTTLTKKSSSW